MLINAKHCRKILLLGSGFVAAPCVEYLVRKPENKVTIGKHETYIKHVASMIDTYYIL